MTTKQQGSREAFSHRSVFIFAAIGSAVGLGNIWRYPAVAFDAGAGAFLIPYLTALLTAGIPLLFLDYALGHKFRGSPPLAFRRVAKWMEPIGWLQVLMCLAISTYYAVVLAWAIRYAGFSTTLAWEDDGAEKFFGATFLQQGEPGLTGAVVWGVAIPLAVIWIINIGILLAGVDKGIGRVNRIFLPLLMILFVLMVAYSLTLEGAAAGLDAFFTPDWAALKEPEVWVAAYGQIFFSLSVAFGAMLTYASYLKRKTNLTGAGLVVAFSNSSFELLAGIGVFACLGFLANAQGVAVADAAAGGPGLAFVAFPSLISEMPFGQVFGTVFFVALVVAGVTSLISITQVVAAAVQEKLGCGRVPAILGVGIVSSVISLAIFPTTVGLSVLDTVDKHINELMLVAEAAIMLVCVIWIARRGNDLAAHLNKVSSFKVGKVWQLMLGVVTPAVLVVMFIQVVPNLIKEPYEGYPADILTTYGWSQLIVLPLLAVVFSLIPFRKKEALPAERDLDQDGIADEDEVMKGGSW